MKHLCTTCTASALSGSCTDRIFRNRGNIDGYKTEATAWQVALGWPDDEEIEEAKAKGYRAEFMTVMAG